MKSVLAAIAVAVLATAAMAQTQSPNPNGALHVKQVQASAPGRIKLISANDSYAPIELERGEVEVIGRVVWKGGRV